MSDLDARARAERLAAALGLTVRTRGTDRHGYSVSFCRGDDFVDGCISPNAVDAWCEAEHRLRGLARCEEAWLREPERGNDDGCDECGEPLPDGLHLCDECAAARDDADAVSLDGSEGE